MTEHHEDEESVSSIIRRIASRRDLSEFQQQKSFYHHAKYQTKKPMSLTEALTLIKPLGYLSKTSK